MTTDKLQNIDWTPLFQYLNENFTTKKEMKFIKKEILLTTKQDLSEAEKKLSEKIAHLPTKEQFYKKMDKWMQATSTHELEKAAHKNDHARLQDHLATHSIL